MPNFWSKTSQYFSEKFYGVSTQDQDFEKSIQNMKNTEKGLEALKNVLHNFPIYTKKFTEFFTDLNSAIHLIYGGSPYNLFIDEIMCKQSVVITQINQMNKIANKLLSKTSEWERIFESAKKSLDQREEKRKVYDHYEKKLSKLKNKANNEYKERNEEKFTKAASEYVDVSEKVYTLIQNSLKLSWDLSNQVMTELIIGELNLFEGISNTLKCFKNTMMRFKEISNSVYNPNANRNTFNYDPMKFMKENDLIKKILISREDTAKSQNYNRHRNSRHTFFGFGNEQRRKKEKLQEKNVDNIALHSRKTNSFGDLPEEVLKEFYDIEDEFSFK